MSGGPLPARDSAPPPPEAWSPLLRLAQWTARPIDRFLHVQAASGIVLLLAAAIALLAANSPFSEAYRAFWHTELGLRLGPWAFSRSLEWWINDGAMVVFFFVVGMEIRRELHGGELSTLRRALLPGAAALGGMVAPALLYLVFAGAPETRSGWGVPMATDIAFAVGVLALLGRRVPPALRVLLLALAVIDDLGAILVIAFFYSDGVSAVGFAVAGGGLLGILSLQRFGVRHKGAYLVPGLITWAGTYAAGVHPTIAGVVIGLVTPVRAWLGSEGFVARLEPVVQQPQLLSAEELHRTLREVEWARREALSPLDALVERLHPWVAFGIMPAFALANAGVALDEVRLEGAAGRVALGVSVGLVVGKSLGIVGICRLTLALGLTTLPRGLGTRHLLVLGAVAGIGFTMALFVAQLAFEDPTLLGAAKLAVLSASALAGLVGVLLGRLLLPIDSTSGGARSAYEAETSDEL